MEDTYGNVIQFRETASSSAYRAKGDTLIENQAKFIVLHLDLLLKVSQPACLVSCEQLKSFGRSNMAPSFSNMSSITTNILVKSPPHFRRSFSTLRTSEVIILEPANGGARKLYALLNSNIDTTVGDSDVPTHFENANITEGIVERP